MSNDSNCYFCGSECEIHPVANMHSINDYRCKYCGQYLIDQRFIERIHGIENKFKIACVLNERRLKDQPGIALSDKTDKNREISGCPMISAGELLDEFPKKASEYFNKVLLNLSRLTEHPFDIIRLNLSNKDCLHFYIQGSKECYAFLHEMAGQGLIRFNEVAGGPQWDVFFRTAKFWELVENLKQTAIDSKQVFVAMWFDKSMDELYKDGIKPAIEKAGYDPIRIDGKDFNGDIRDEIIAEIKRSKFIVADFCGQRQAVYFEAGYAMGQGKPVIFTASEEELDNLNFDTRQYNHIGYNSPEDLRKKLYNRICATIV